MACPHLEYRTESDDRSFDHERAFCRLAGSFVRPVKADICNDRFEFDHREQCDLFREYAEGLKVVDAPGSG